jgi:curved DNA-binding protein CbpA
MFDQSTPFNNAYFNESNVPNTSSVETKDPYEVLGLQRGATQEEIKSAYRRLAMKNHPDRVQGTEAKQIATAKFSEISAAYELLTTQDNAGASHPSFAGASQNYVPSYTQSHSQYPNFGAFGMHQQPFMNSFGMRFDPFGFGTFDDFHFTDPFELFRRTFGDINHDTMAFGTSYSASTGMNVSGFSGFPSMFGNLMGGNFPVNGSGSTISSSSYSYGGAGGSGKVISTTAKTVNGRTITRTEQTTINPDGTKHTVVLTGDDIVDKKMPAIQAIDTRKKRSKYSQNLLGSHKQLNPQQTRNDRRNQDVSDVPPKSQQPKQYQSDISVPGNKFVLASGLPENKTTSAINAETEAGMKSKITVNNNDGVATKTRSDDYEPSQQHHRGRKRKFYDSLYKCFTCCFPPCKHRRVANESSNSNANSRVVNLRQTCDNR